MAQTELETPPQTHTPPRKAVVPVRRSFGWRLMTALRSWAHTAFEREQMIATLKSLAWVAPMTVIIWVYAEREQTSTQVVAFHIEARNNDPGRLIELLGPGPDGHLTNNFTVHAELTGPNQQLEQEKQKLEGGGILQIELPEGLRNGEQQIDLASLLINDATLKHEGLLPSNIAPGQITVFVDPIIERDVLVRIRPNVTNLEAPHFSPAKIEVKGPQSVLNAAAADGKLVAYADLPALTEPGPKSLSNVPVALPINDPRVHLATASVSADVTVKSVDVEGDLHGIAVLASYPQGEPWDKFKVQYDATLPDVKVVGPPDVIANVDAPDYPNKPKAFLDLTSASPGFGNAPQVGKQYTVPLLFDFGNTGLKISPNFPKTITVTVAERKSGTD